MYDAIVVGARCAGAPTAMLLARKGYRVLLLDKARFPSDTISTHLMHVAGVAALQRWGLLDEALATGAPKLDGVRFEVVGVELTGSALPLEGVDYALCLRRQVLDTILVRAAEASGVEVREDFVVEGLTFAGECVTGISGKQRGGATVEEKAKIVIGADGRNSLVARGVEAPAYNELPVLGCTYYTYWSGMSDARFEFYIKDKEDRAVGVFPTNDGLTCVFTEWPRSQFGEYKKDIEGNYHQTLSLVPEVAEKVKAGRREERFVGTGDLPISSRNRTARDGPSSATPATTRIRLPARA